MPTEFHLFQDNANPNEHTLEVDFMHAFDKSLNEDYTVRVVLPEGATNIKVELPSICGVSEENISMGKFFGTLDYFGRPEITITKKNAVHDLCDQLLVVKYHFNNSRDLYIEVFCMFGLLFSLYFTAMVYQRLGFQLEKKQAKNQVQAQEKHKTQ
mmetsp:Transcript_13825/g.23582  ORF Transcript_13825/g.23582 Transcript_13825/m.23582 type:complete len:155 (-) Transcript_13825:46-510(-)